jgi:predicted alpha/beta-hydrolase family hydrolase
VSVDRDRQQLAVDDDLVASVTVVVHRPTRARGPGLLLTHGAGKDLDAPHLVALADAVAAEGVLVVRANQPWKQSGRAVPPRPPRALPGYAAVAAAVRTTFGPRRGWVVGGHSNGARLTTHALAAGGDLGVRAVGGLLVSFPLHAPGRAVGDRLEHWSAVTHPLCFVQGTNDPFGGVEELRSHLRRLAGPAEVLPVAGGDHGLAVAASRSSDGRRRPGDAVAATLGAAVAAWIAGLSASAA